MSNLFSAMRSAASALDVLQKSALAAQNNVSNASTPGYAKQRASLSARAFDPQRGLSGGVQLGPLLSSRDEHAEKSVRTEFSAYSASQTLSTHLNSLESIYDLNDVGGIPARMNQLFSAFQSWSAAPLSTAEKENVISSARDVATSFNQAAAALQGGAQNAEMQIQSTLTRIDDLAERIRQHNVAIRRNDGNDAGADATMNADLEELASYVSFHTLHQSDGTVTVLVGGQTTLVSGDQKFTFSTTPDTTVPPPDLAGATPKLRVMDSNGFDVTSTITGGQLGGLLDIRNRIIPSYAGSVTDAGDLNRLAKGFADRVNQLLTSGDPDPAASVPLFTYSNTGAAAHSLKVSDAMTPAVLSASDPSVTPANVNGRALALAQLAHPSNAADQISGLSFVSYFGRISENVGRASREAKANSDSQSQLHAQAVSFRQALSGVSLDEEAVNLTTIQRAYEASSRIIAAIDELTKIAVNIGRN